MAFKQQNLSISIKRFCCLILIITLVSLSLSCFKAPEDSALLGINKPAPSFTLSDLEGKKVSLEDYRDKVVMIEFFTTWCLPCQMSAPDIQSVFEKYKDKGFYVIAISIDEGSNSIHSVKTFVKEYNISFPTLMDDGRVSKKYGVFSIPTAFIIDRNGNIRNKHIGISSDFKKIISKEIEALL